MFTKGDRRRPDGESLLRRRKCTRTQRIMTMTRDTSTMGFMCSVYRFAT